MDKTVLEQLKAAYAAATPGPWVATQPWAGFAQLRAGQELVFALANPDAKFGDRIPTEEKYANLALIPLLHNAFPSLVAHVEALEAQLVEANARASVCINVLKGFEMAAKGAISQETFEQLLLESEQHLLKAAEWLGGYMNASLAGLVERDRQREGHTVTDGEAG